MQIVDAVLVYRLSSPELIRWHSRRHSHPAPQLELHYFLSDDGRFEAGRDRYAVENGTLCMTLPGEEHRVVPRNAARPLSYYAILFTLEDRPDLEQALCAAADSRHFPRSRPLRDRHVLEDVTTRFAHPQYSRRQAGLSLLEAYLWDLVAGIEAVSTDPAADPHETGYNVHVDRALQLLHANAATGIRIAELAARVGVRPEHLSRLFRRWVGMSPRSYAERLRMEVAASRLVNSTRSVKEIAWELGFSQPVHFSRSFRRFSGMSPGAYRTAYYRAAPTAYAGKLLS